MKSSNLYTINKIVYPVDIFVQFCLSKQKQFVIITQFPIFLYATIFFVPDFAMILTNSFILQLTEKCNLPGEVQKVKNHFKRNEKR